MKAQCIVHHCTNPATGPSFICSSHWFKLPVALRMRWWNETDYSRNPPSPALLKAVLDAVRS